MARATATRPLSVPMVGPLNGATSASLAARFAIFGCVTDLVS